MAKLLHRDGMYWFPCPACKVSHRVDKNWSFNGDFERPTLIPRMKTLTLQAGKNLFCFCRVQRGYIEFDPTSTHALAGHTLLLPDWDDAEWVDQKKGLLPHL